MPPKHSAKMLLASAFLCKEDTKGPEKEGEKEGPNRSGSRATKAEPGVKRLVRVVTVRGARKSEIWCTAALAHQKLPRST